MKSFKSFIENTLLWIFGIWECIKYFGSKAFNKLKKLFESKLGRTVACILLVAVFIYSSVSILSMSQIAEAKNAETIPTVIVTEETTMVTEPFEDDILSNDEIELIALVTMGEAEDEPERGKRLVIDTILNRVDSDRFPNTVKEVIYQPNQFEVMWNGRLDRCYVSDDICKLVKEELIKRDNSKVVFFRADKFSDYGTPMFCLGNHYFSSI